MGQDYTLTLLGTPVQLLNNAIIIIYFRKDSESSYSSLKDTIHQLIHYPPSPERCVLMCELFELRAEVG